MCQAGPTIAFLVLTAYYLFPSILESIWFCVYHVMNVPPFPFFGFFTFFGGRLGNSPLAHSGVLWVLAMAGHPPQEELLSLCPLTLGWWPYHLPAARGFSSLPLSVGWGGTTSLAPHLHLEAKVGPPTGHCVFHMHASGSVRRSERVVAAHCVVSWQGSGLCHCLWLRGSCRKGICS